MSEKRAFNYSFRLYLEGINIPFTAATIVCTPNGVEANINVYSNKEILDLKPKTSAQIFFKEWNKDKPAWRLMFDGFFSTFYKVDQASEGRQIGLVCRDFRMDIRKAPAALAWEGEQDLTTRNHYNSMGIFHTFAIKGVTKGKGTDIRIFGGTGLVPLSYTLSLIAGTVGYKFKKAKDGQSFYAADFDSCTPADSNNVANCGFYLDALVRGLWVEAVGGTAVGTFINKRIKMDKRFLIPVNKSGYNFWTRQAGSIHIGSHLMGNSRFSSLEAAIMRLAGAFSTRVYSCNSPSLIPIGDDENKKPNKAVTYIMDPGVRDFIIKKLDKEFGAKYVLNESMLLPPLEFTAPPNCNLFFPPMYDRVEFTYDMDSDVTRGYYTMTHMLSTAETTDLCSINYQVPNALFNIMGKSKDGYGRQKPALTLEERYKGINVDFGSVSHELACNDAVKLVKNRQVKAKKSAELEKEVEQIKSVRQSATVNYTPKDATVFSEFTKGITKQEETNDKETKDAQKDINAKLEEIKKLRQPEKTQTDKHVKDALMNHSVLKYLNMKYQGRVVAVDMAFNPYVMCGFPGAVVVDDSSYGGKSGKTILGMVQQVKHTIYITTESGEANTSVVMNNARFEDEPTDVDINGIPLFMKATDQSKAEIDIKTYKYLDAYYVIPGPKQPISINLDSVAYDLKTDDSISYDYKYAKDILSMAEGGVTKSGTSQTAGTTKEELKKIGRNAVYLDEIYEPTSIAAFYKHMFGHKAHSFMVGSFTKDDKASYFMYDTIHEALQNLQLKKELMNEYDRCLEFIERNICSADAFFNGILGLSFKTTIGELKKDQSLYSRYLNDMAAVGADVSTDKDTDEAYITRLDNFDDETIYDEYFGVSTPKFYNKEIEALTGENGMMKVPGDCSSINEHMPITAFIKERKESVKLYRDEAIKQATGT